MNVEEAKIFLASLERIPMTRHEVSEELIDKLNVMMKIFQSEPSVWYSTKDLPLEIWRDVVGYEGLYQVSNMGRLKSLHYEKSVILNPSTASDGYINVTLTRNGEKKYCRLHILVAQAFIPNPDNLPVVHHDDDNKANCRADNLQWTTHSENTKLAYESGAAKSGCKHHNLKFTSEQVKEIR